MEKERKNRIAAYLWIFIGIALLVRIGLIFTRWVNPDEGAHLLDARMVLDGLLPIVDYESRQPLYIFSLAFLFKMFGVHLWVGRLLPALSTLGTGWIIYLIGKRMFSVKVGLIAFTVYLFLPLTLVWSVIVKSEPLGVFFGCVSIYFVLRTFDQTVRNTGWTILAGMFSALAYYSRQTLIYIPVIVLFYFLLRRDIKKGQKFSYSLQYLLGYAAICVAFGAFYIRELGLNGILLSQLDPLNLVYLNVLNVLGALPPELRINQSSGARVLDQDITVTLNQWKHVFYFSLYILVGAFAVGVRSIWGSTTDNRIREKMPENRYHYLLLILWIIFVALPYIAQSIVRGFYTQYYMEFLPPLVVLASVYFEVIYNKVGSAFYKFIGLCLLVMYGILLVQKVFWQYYPGVGVYMLAGALAASASLYFYSRKWEFRVLFIINLVSVLLISIVYYSLVVAKVGEVPATLITMFILYFVVKNLTFRLMKYRANIRMSSYVRTYIVIVAFVVTAAYSGRYLGPQYESVWSLKTVAGVRDVLQDKGEPQDTVLSGGSIWALEGFYPFMGKTHPTEFLKQNWSDFETQFQNDRPRFIVVDGYTEKKFSMFWDIIEKELQINYTSIARFSDSHYPVTVYMLNDEQSYPEPFQVLQN